VPSPTEPIGSIPQTTGSLAAMAKRAVGHLNVSEAIHDSKQCGPSCDRAIVILRVSKCSAPRYVTSPTTTNGARDSGPQGLDREHSGGALVNVGRCLRNAAGRADCTNSRNWLPMQRNPSKIASLLSYGRGRPNSTIRSRTSQRVVPSILIFSKSQKTLPPLLTRC